MDDVIADKKGLKTAVEELHDPDAPVPDDMDGEQLDLLPLHKASEGRQARGRMDLVTRGRGRPPGAKNKNTEDWRDYLLARYTAPLIGLAETYNRPLMDLAEDLGYLTFNEDGSIKRGPDPDELKDLYAMQLSCMKELAPYVHQKQPQAVDLNGDKGMLQLNIYGGVPAEEIENADGFDMEILDVTSEGNQEVSAGENAKSNGGKSNDHAQSEGEQGADDNQTTDLQSVESEKQ